MRLQATQFSEGLGLGLKLLFTTKLDGCPTEWEYPSTKKRRQYEAEFTKRVGNFRQTGA